MPADVTLKSELLVLQLPSLTVSTNVVAESTHNEAAPLILPATGAANTVTG